MYLTLYPDPYIAKDSLLNVLAYAVGNPKPDHLERLIAEVYTPSVASLYVLCEGTQVAAVIGIKHLPDFSGQILHIAVEKIFRHQGWGRFLIAEVVKREQLNRVMAETDGDTVDFYRRCGFVISSLGEKYPGVERFHCLWTQ
ncbi:Acetyltransferase (GNAT) domain-containing protein [Sulfobacillus thermosulfidooxidans DSM 9293]|uniref:Acetyltransferase (GNAT) domain-containing protein n=1 Tax=Sulfobacillus thermosulfidooxidans (strain DSM 9293 / VKM B-1269 / AT-1) TaxID=929705 RepID=A0A1W1W818_SULTA|nr:GNAT family N-acetyltransferase [Sulfobacillus thermosulfidooxidans]SMC02405.1 Acetyltransferase (GNAT) domain-containing protein [Sulfobacillus thermosulfidooxidans DSM 9293]